MDPASGLSLLTIPASGISVWQPVGRCRLAWLSGGVGPRSGVMERGDMTSTLRHDSSAQDGGFDADSDSSDAARSSVSKALDLLEVLVDAPGGEASLSDLSLRARMPKSTVHRLLGELISHGLVGRLGSNYCAGLKLTELGARSRWLEHRELLRVATPVLEWLFEKSRSTVHLGVLRGPYIVYLEKISSSGGSRIPSRVGARLPASCTSLGKVLLAANGFAERVSRVGYGGVLPAMTPYSVRDPRLLAGELRESQVSGLAYDNQESHLGVHCVAAPIMSSLRPVAAVSVSGFGPSVIDDHHVACVREAARRIAVGLG